MFSTLPFPPTLVPYELKLRLSNGGGGDELAQTRGGNGMKLSLSVAR
jgi:hypothetical protein